jgi:DNA-binding NarL/FixJ family response regulator
MKILIADDHSVVRKGLRMILAETYPLAQITEVPDAFELLNKAGKEEWTVIISDISMPGRSGADIVKEIKELAPKTPLLILSGHAPQQYAVKTIKSGASGYLTKESAPEELVKAIERVLGGKKYITAEIAELLAYAYGDDTDKLPHQYLSDRELEVFKLISAGNSTSEAANILSLSVNTISTYRTRILEKMHLHSNADLIKYALQHHLH